VALIWNLIYRSANIRFWRRADIASCTVHVRFWPEADIASCTAHVRYRGQSGHPPPNATKIWKAIFHHCGWGQPKL